VIPKNIQCEDCGRQTKVRGYGRIVYDWTDDRHEPATLNVKMVHLTVDCPRCGVRIQQYYPAEQHAEI
jgi:DNA-directed RNA polymerase subunit RPC12/RpoP